MPPKDRTGVTASVPPATTALPSISIVTLSFNQAQFLDAAIASITGQGYSNLDYIVVDPGSTDSSRAIIEARRDVITTVLLDPDDGPADGLNKGFAAATGDVFGYINADDMLLPGALATIARHFNDNPDVDAILGNGIVINDDGSTRRQMKSSRFSMADFGHGAMTFVQQGHFFRRNAFAAAGGFNIANRTCWDAELLVDMANSGARFINVPEQLGAFRLYGETITGSGRLAEAMKIDTQRYQAKALGRAPAAHDRIAGPLRLIVRRLSDPLATLDGLRDRLSPGKAQD